MPCALSLRMVPLETSVQRSCGLVRAEQEKQWLQENRGAIASINAFIDRHGLLADRLRLRRERMKG
jgi:post-segregation antitoxin (ccd killing protein)